MPRSFIINDIINLPIIYSKKYFINLPVLPNPYKTTVLQLQSLNISLALFLKHKNKSSIYFYYSLIKCLRLLIICQIGP